MNAPTASEEERMAMSLRNDRDAGNMLALSSIDQVSNLGTGMTKNTMAAAKQAGDLKQAREKAELDRSQRAETQAGLNEYRASMLAQATERQRALEESRLAKIKIDKNKLKLQYIKRDDKVGQWGDKFGLDVERFSQNVNQTGIENDQKDQFRLDDIRRFDLKHGLNVDKLGLGRDKFESDTEFKTANLAARVSHWSDTLGYNIARDDKVLGQKEDQFTREIAKDIRQFALKHDLDWNLAAIKFFDAKSKDEWRKDKLYFDITGSNSPGDQGNMTKVGASERTKFEADAEAAQMAFTFENTFKDEYANISGMPLEGSIGRSIVTHAPILKGLYEKGVGKDVTNMSTWWANYSTMHEMGERHEMFGAAFTDPERKIWEASAIKENMSAEDIRQRLQNLSWVMRRQSEKAARVGKAKGMPKNYILENYGFLGDSTNGLTNTFEDMEAEKLNIKNAKTEIKSYSTDDLNNMSAEELTAYLESLESNNGINR